MKLLLTIAIFLCIDVMSATAKRDKQRDPVVKESFFNSTAFHDKVTNIYQINRNADLYCKGAYGSFYFYASTNDCKSCADLCTDPSKEMEHQCLDKCGDFMINHEWEKKYSVLESELKILRDQNVQMQQQQRQTWKIVVFGFVGVAVGFIASGLVVWRVMSLERLYNKDRYAKRHPLGCPEGDSLDKMTDRTSIIESYSSVPVSDE